MDDIKFKYWVTNELYENLYEPSKWKNWILTEEYKKFIKKGDKILEIGSGNGFTTCLFKSITGNEGIVVGVELVPNNCLIANSMIALNQFEKCHILNFAAYQKSGKENYKNKDNGVLTYSESEETSKIDTMECDKLIKDYGFFDIIILDVNGFELNVLKGCSELLTSKPKIILNLFEFKTPFNTSNFQEILDIIDASNYEGLVYIFAENKLVPFDYESLNNSSQVQEYY
ncbi:MAG: FkbM family methyltransferase [Ignavibacteria bacterium]|nr:FkbM family methyltransferase [Ignavibacteria bacterium]